MTEIPTRRDFTDAYAGEAPWDIGRPQHVFANVADQVAGPVLDAGCGTGDTALFFAGRGLAVTGIDYLEEPIRRAKAKAAERGIDVDFRVANALELEQSGDRYASIVDSGLFHVFSDEDRRRYVRGVAHVLQPGGRLFLMCFSEAEPGEQGPRRIRRQELNEAFAAGWEIKSVTPARFEFNPNFVSNPRFAGMEFSQGGPHAWFAIVRRSP